MRQWRANNPVRSRYTQLRQNAHRRGISFTLTYEEFHKLVSRSGYVGSRENPNFCNQLHIDRKDHLLGYQKGNVEIITADENVAKSRRERYLPEHVKAARAAESAKPLLTAQQQSCADEEERHRKFEETGTTPFD